MKIQLFAIAALTAALDSAAIPRIIFDTDMCTDPGDVGALACLHALADEGLCEILATVSSTRDNQSVAAIEVINGFYGRPDIPVGCSKEIGVVGVPGNDPARRGHQKYVRLAKEYAHWVRHANSNDAPDANEVYRRILAAAPDRSVTICSVGFLTNLRRLLETPGDRHSPLGGRALVKRKVVCCYAMACQTPRGRQHNIRFDAASAKRVFERWPTAITVVDHDLGANIFSGRTCAERHYAYRNPVHDIFAESLAGRAAYDQRNPGGCRSGDAATVLAAVFLPSRFFQSQRGVYTLDDRGTSDWTPVEKGRFYHLLPSVTRERHNFTNRHMGNIIDELIAREPRRFRVAAAAAIARQAKLVRTANGPRLAGGLAARPRERMDRGLVASVSERGTYVGWRLLDTDAPDRPFDLYRRAGHPARIEKLNAAPIVQTSDFFIPGCTDRSAEYSLDGRHFTPVRCEHEGAPFIRIPLADTNALAAAVSVADLDGDGAYDYVVKTPAGGTDPWDLVWRRATDTCKLEAYRSDGRFLWRRDLGWNIELGICYSPFVTADLDGDGRAEVIAKTAPLSPDFRDPEGRVMSGPEHLTVYDGLTGEVRAQTDWIVRGAPDPVYAYNHFTSRNKIAIAHIDGKTPCVIVARGTYGRIVVEAHRFTGSALERVWRFDNEFMSRELQGQCDHACLCADVDGDGCDEILLGSLTLDHDGSVLWNNGRGHSDAHYYGDIDPRRPGMELAFVYETRQQKGGGLLLADPATGREIWALAEPTRHVHSRGICADLAPEHPGLEIYGQETAPSGGSKQNTHPGGESRWFFAADGTLISSHTNCTYKYGFGARNAYWDADLQREVFRGAIFDHEGLACTPRLPGPPLVVADLFGDWREEFIAVCRGELRIYTTDIPAMDRRTTLMRDRSYRSRIRMCTSGYAQQPILLYVPSATAPNLSLRFRRKLRDLRLDVTAPLDRPLRGTLTLNLPEGWSASPFDGRIDLSPGELWTRTVRIRRPPKLRGRYESTLILTRPDAPALTLRQPLVL